MNQPLRIHASELAGLVAKSKKSARTRARMTAARAPTGATQTQPVSFTIEGRPKGKGRPRFNRNSSHAYTPASTVAYERQIRSAARIAMENHQPMDGPVSIAVRAVFAVSKSWPKAKRNAALNGEIHPTAYSDADNVLKAALDGCNRVVFEDDIQVVEANITKEYGERPHLHIIARPLCKSTQPGEQPSHAPIALEPNAPMPGARPSNQALSGKPA